MDIINTGRQRAREEKSRQFHERSQLLSTVFASAESPAVETARAPVVLSVRDKIMMEKAARFQARLENN